MPRRADRLEGVRAIGRPEPALPWIGFGQRAGEYRLVVGTPTDVRDAAAGTDLLLAVAIAYFAEAFEGAPSDLEATQSDLSALVRHLMHREARHDRRGLLAQALDAIDDGLAGDAVAATLAAAGSPGSDRVDPVELLVARANELLAEARPSAARPRSSAP